MKAHLLDSDDPLREGLTYKALCGKEVKDSSFVFMFDVDAESCNFYDSLNKLNTCGKCLDITIEKRYVYGVVQAQIPRDEAEAA
jgi:hypothetical protein